MTNPDPAQTLAELSRQLRSHDDFASTLRLFFDRVAETEWVHAGSSPERHPKLEAVLTRSLEALPKLRGQRAQAFPTRYEGTDFLHGFVIAGPTTGVFFYFEATDQGLLAVPTLDRPGHMQYLRFTVLAVPADVAPAPGPHGPSS